MAPALVILNISGRQFGLTTDLLAAEPESILAQLVCDSWKCDSGLSDVYIHRDPSVFPYILSYLRYDYKASMPTNECMFNQLVREAEFYQLHGLLAILWCVQASHPLIDTRIKAEMTVRWNPGVISLFWQTVAINSRCFTFRKKVHQVAGRVKYRYKLKDSTWCSYDIVCLACSKFDFAIMSSAPDFKMLESLVKQEMLVSRGRLKCVSRENRCALVEWNHRSEIYHIPLRALLIA